jgi:hypothetical protein
MVAGFGAFALFFFTLAVSLRGIGTAAGFALATAVALATQGLVLALTRPRRESRLATAKAELGPSPGR